MSHGVQSNQGSTVIRYHELIDELWSVVFTVQVMYTYRATLHVKYRLCLHEKCQSWKANVKCCLEKIVILLSHLVLFYRWYWGKTSRVEAEKRLNTPSVPTGGFCVRNSESLQGERTQSSAFYHLATISDMPKINQFQALAAVVTICILLFCDPLMSF